MGEEALLVHVRAVVAVLRLDGVRGEEDGRLGRTVHLIVEDRLLHLQEENPLNEKHASVVFTAKSIGNKRS